jgi:acyl carrier protein
MGNLPASAAATTDAAAISRIIANVLRVPVERVHPDAELIHELGAESIDFLDLLFNLDELTGRRVLPEHYGAWLRQRFPGGGDGHGITPRLIEEFVVFYRSSAPSAAGDTP